MTEQDNTVVVDILATPTPTVEIIKPVVVKPTLTKKEQRRADRQAVRQNKKG